MMFMLRDDRAIEVFESPNDPPHWIEGIDIENKEYEFCDESGQKYDGQILKSSGKLKQATWVLRSTGYPDLKNLDEMITRAESIEPNDHFSDLEALRTICESAD